MWFGMSLGCFQHFKLQIESCLQEILGAKQFMQFCILSHWYWFLVIIKMPSHTAVREYQKKISEEYNSINLNIRTLCAATKRNILNAESL